MRWQVMLLGALGVTVPVMAQQAATVNTATAPKASVSITHRGADAATFVTLKAENVPLRDALRDVAAQAGVRILMSPSVGGAVTVSIEEQPLAKAVALLATSGGSSARAIVVPAGQEDRVTLESAAALYEATAALPAGTRMTDPSGKEAAIQNAASGSGGDGGATVFYVQGKLTPSQERAAAARRETERVAAEAAKNASPANPDQFISQALTGLRTLTPEKRVGVMMDFMRQFQNSMSDEERQQMRDAFRNYFQQNRPQGGPGGPGGPPPIPFGGPGQ